MLTDKFFEEYAKTGAPKTEPATEAKEKEYYSKAEVDKIVSDRLAEAISAIREEQLTVVDNSESTPESTNESDV